MADKVGDEFEGYITGVTAFGLFIELIEHFVEGLVHVSTMADDYYRFVERAHILRGENNGKVYRLGDRVTVQVVKVDMERRQIDLGLVEILEAVRAVGAEPRAAPQQCRAAAAAPSPAARAGAGASRQSRQEKKDKPEKAPSASSGPAAASAPCGKAGEDAMKNVLGQDVALDDAFLDRMRETIDPPADAVATTLVEQGAAASSRT